MNKPVWNSRDILRAAILAVTLAVLSVGCGSDDSNSTGNDQEPVDYSPNIDDDIATLMAASLAADNGVRRISSSISPRCRSAKDCEPRIW